MVDLKIIVIGDDSKELLDIKRTLESFGYSILLMAHSKGDPINLAQDKPDIVLMDLSLKGDLELVPGIENLDLPTIYLIDPADFQNLNFPEEEFEEPDTYLSRQFNAAELKYAIELVIYKNKIIKKFKQSEYKVIWHTGTATVII